MIMSTLRILHVRESERKSEQFDTPSMRDFPIIFPTREVIWNSNEKKNENRRKKHKKIKFPFFLFFHFASSIVSPLMLMKSRKSFSFPRCSFPPIDSDSRLLYFSSASKFPFPESQICNDFHIGNRHCSHPQWTGTKTRKNERKRRWGGNWVTANGLEKLR